MYLFIILFNIIFFILDETRPSTSAGDTVLSSTTIISAEGAVSYVPEGVLVQATNSTKTSDLVMEWKRQMVIERENDHQKEKERESEQERQKERERYREKERERERERERQMVKERERERQRQKERESERKRQKERAKERHCQKKREYQRSRYEKRERSEELKKM